MPVPSELSVLSEADWEELLLYIQNRQVVPVVGPELITIEDQGMAIPLTRWAAPRLAEYLQLRAPQEFTALNEVACAYLLTEGSDRHKIYNGLRLLLRDIDRRFEPSPVLLQLAEITDFDLFISTTFDPLLGVAMERARPGFARSRDVMAYDMKPATAFPDPVPASFVYHILGRLETFPDFAVWEEDYLEYLCHLVEQSREAALEGLFRQLRTRHLLLLGAPFADWIVRFFLRAARGRRLSAQREFGSREYLADLRANVGEPTVFFFNSLARATRIIEGDPSAFVRELSARWRKSREVSHSTQDFLERMAGEIPKGAVFISYSRNDIDAAARLAMRLSAANVPVWFDQERLRIGENYERSLEHGVREGCSFFLSLISAATEANMERYVHKERAWAASRYQDGFVFYLPVIVDDTADSNVKLEPACFGKIHRDRLPAGEPTEVFVQRMRQLIEQWRISGRPRD
jgi:hypothetical protein